MWIYIRIFRKTEIWLWKLIFDCGKKHISSCFVIGCTAWQVRDRSQESHLHCVPYCWKSDVTKTVADADGREKIEMAESSDSISAAVRVVWTPRNLRGPIWKYFGFWSVDGKNAELRDKVACKLCKRQLAYHSTTSNMRAHTKCAPKWVCHDVWNSN